VKAQSLLRFWGGGNPDDVIVTSSGLPQLGLEGYRCITENLLAVYQAGRDYPGALWEMYDRVLGEFDPY